MKAQYLSLVLVGCLHAAPLQAEAPPAEGSATAEASQEHASQQQENPELKKKELGKMRPVHALGDIYLTGQPQPEDLPILKDEGIKTIITLRKPAEIRWDERKAIAEQGIKFVEIPFSGPDELKPEVFDEALKILRDKKRGPVVLHCGSANRVGSIWYAYRMLDGKLSPEAALKEAKTVGLRTPGYLDKAQEYVEQKAKEGEANQTGGESNSGVAKDTE